MKKITGLAATLAITTAFCGICAGYASGVTADADGAVAPSADTAAHVILNPGAFYKNGIEDGAKVTKLSSTQEGEYFVENAYFANYNVGDKLPKATTTRTDVTFDGWRYALNGETVTVTTMPKVTENLFLYAHWTSGSNPKPTPTPTPIPGGKEIALTENSAAFKFSDATVVIKVGFIPTWAAQGTGLVYIEGTKWEDRYALNGTSTYTVNKNLADVTLYVGFMQGSDGKNAKVPGSSLVASKVNTVTNKNGANDTFEWNDDGNWLANLTTSDITYKN